MVDALDFSDKATILVVDDTPDNLQLMSGLLKDKYKVQVANSGERALKAAMGDNPPDLVLLDIMMPGMDGYEVCRRLVADERTRDIPIIFLTGKTQVEDETMGFELGAADYITKPISPPIVLARIKIQLLLKAARDYLKDKSDFLEAEVARRTAENSALQARTINALTSVAEKIIATGKGGPFDAEMATSFVEIAEQIRAITDKSASTDATGGHIGTEKP